MREVAQQVEKRHGDHDGGIRVPAERSPKAPACVHGHHEEGAVREVDDAQHAEDQAEPERDAAVDAAQQEAVDDGVEKN
ncbi:hypothetical protein D3C71_1947170 [compost metagenome]